MEPFACPHCHFILILPDHYAGKKIACPRCKKEIEVPNGKKEGEKNPPKTE